MKEKINKKQLAGLRRYRDIMVKSLIVILIMSLWIKVGLNPNWHMDDIVVEIVSLFILIVMGILSNIRNDFPIFHARSLKLSKEFAYSLTSFFIMTFVFVIYKNIMEPDFISYIASLSFHDLCTLLVFLFPIAIFIILVIYFSFRLINDTKKEKIRTYDSEIERNINKYKVLSVKGVYILMLLAIWAKVGLNNNFTYTSILVEVISILVVSILFIVGNIRNGLEPLHNFHFKIDRYFFYAILLPYLLIVIYSVFNSSFRGVLQTTSIKSLISIGVYMSPILLMASLVFYIGAKYPNLFKDLFKKNNIKENKIRFNSIISLLITIVILVIFFLYSLKEAHTDFSVESILQLILIFIPIGLTIYLILYSGIKEINK